MDDDQFVHNIVEKIERMTGCRVDVQVDHLDAGKLEVKLDGDTPRIVMGANIFKYAGFARMCIEYATASIQRKRPIDVLEFHLLLARN